MTAGNGSFKALGELNSQKTMDGSFQFKKKAFCDPKVASVGQGGEENVTRNGHSAVTCPSGTNNTIEIYLRLSE
jgi:hypothetical protein